MAALKEIVLTGFCLEIITKTINIKTITILFYRQDSVIRSMSRFESNYMTV